MSTPEIFVDTSGFYACLVKRDDVHLRAKEILDRAARDKLRFATTDYVLDETATLLRMRNLGHLALDLFDVVLQSDACRIEWMNPLRFASTQEFFAKHSDQDYSFTDCFSFTIMRELQLTEAFTKDAHFQAAGFMPLLVD